VATSVECVVLGAGPAGLSAALWLRKLGVEALVLEGRDALGGEVARVSLPVRDYLGLPAIDGRAFLRAALASLEAADLTVRLGTPVGRVDARRREVHLGDEVLAAPTLIIATGLTRRGLGLPGSEELRGRGLSDSATRDRALFAGQPVAVVGGGDGALENALLCAACCPRVFLIHRRAAFRARPEFVRRVAAEPRIEVLAGSAVVGLERAGDRLAGIELASPAGPRRLAVPWLVVKVGFVPNTAVLGGTVALDAAGYVIVDRLLGTSAAGVFAAGDVANPRAPCIATAVGDGAMAARGVAELLRGGGDQ
jgi:thioredoxin reductase (NADPH)